LEIPNKRVIAGVLMNLLLNLKIFWNRWILLLVNPYNILRSIKLYQQYLSDWYNYSRLPSAEILHFADSYPCINDRTTITPFDAHYFYQGVWAFRKIKESGVKSHIDVGSEIRWVGLLSTITKVTFIDIRPFETDLKDLIVKKGDILNMPFEDKSVDSLSCLHVAEHIGLGRYGDSLDPEGTKKATHEFARVLAPQGNLYFSVPVGKPRVCFNAHRIHSPQQILDYFHDLKLLQFSGISDSGTFRQDIDPGDLANSNYACGLFHFTKKHES